ncbi:MULTISPECIES: MFS transporter [Chryseobacterium]|uniref:Lysosomal dipeptide transporter MFSD1 n=1 Tax=Chryseobacterium camelliae TaxID=1265445 RepID=A0ABU0TLZ1_9FLAO|nr:MULTISPECIES: MFS transporter [Chryseobacterium]MDT3408076.1 MFS family permease [Pseudacidovorax intermedius]MDQ1098069.1 MFS family permease [Chryseobacterium camelliae]MDQ1102000.1 MFS family permease [Chryseobacterium sp. SORGH_AS_1048]MDR6085436.1 MFS family permease [Chryseobacterium sp. SORGH_AS_0909]MDR6129800.1 MFS family permease [Chryseobacterium sp. SORGH_AS_1175]
MISDSLKKFYIIAWVFGLVFYFLDYVIRSAPAVMIPELVSNFNTTELKLISMVGTYYYTYSTCSLIAGIALDKFGGKRSIFAGTFILGIGCLLFLFSSQVSGITGRLLQGAGCAFAFPGCVYLASKGFSSKSLATAIGVTQCIGMLGGTAGQFMVGPWIKEGMNIDTFWLWSGIITLITAVVLFFVIPGETKENNREEKALGYLEPYKIVFRNPQSWLCGIISGLLFAPTTIFAMTWAVAFFEKDKGFEFSDAAITSAMVAFGWVFGCPLLGFITDKIGLRKPVLAGGAILMILSLLQLIYLPDLYPAKISMFVLGLGSGAAMIPYSVIKEANPDYVKGSATGAINFITFGVTTLLNPVFSRWFGKSLGNVPGTIHFQHSVLFWIAGIVLAILVSLLLRETGRKVNVSAD